MKSLILKTATLFLKPLLLLFSVYLLLAGHHKPGGGFTGGLMAAAAFALHGLTYGIPSARRLLPVSPHMLIGLGLLTAASSGVIGLFLGEPYLTGIWGGAGEKPWFGTPLLFDAGVYLTVIGGALWIILTLAEEED